MEPPRTALCVILAATWLAIAPAGAQDTGTESDTAPQRQRTVGDGPTAGSGRQDTLVPHARRYPERFRLPVQERRARRRHAPAEAFVLEAGADSAMAPRGFQARHLVPRDDFIERALAEKRLELVEFVDSEDRRVFLGLTRDGYLGVQVQMREPAKKP